MRTPLEALYAYAAECDDLTHWLFDRDIIETYRQSVTYAEVQSARLTERLSPENAALLKNLQDDLRDAHSLELEMQFRQGLAMGLQLGALALLT